MRKPWLAAALIVPLLATAGVALFASAPRSPVAYCRTADPFFTDLGFSGNAHRSGQGDEATSARSLVLDSAKAQPQAPSSLKPDWNLLHAAAVRITTTGLAATADQPQLRIDASLRRVFGDYRRRCVAYLFPGSAKSVDVAGLIGQPPEVAYCQRARTLFTDILATPSPDSFARDRLVSEAQTAVKVAPAALADDWTSTLDALVRLLRTGSSADASHPQPVVDAASGRLYDDSKIRCPTPISPPSG